MIYILRDKANAEQRVAFESLINIRPKLGNRNILIQSDELRQQVESVTRDILGGLQWSQTKRNCVSDSCAIHYRAG